MPSYSVSTDPDAELNIERTANWYNFEAPGRGDKFRDQVYSQINSLRENPRRHAIKYRDVHSAPMKNRPFSIHYTVDEQQKTVIIRAFIDNRRGPLRHPRHT